MYICMCMLIVVLVEKYVRTFCHSRSQLIVATDFVMITKMPGSPLVIKNQ